MAPTKAKAGNKPAAKTARVNDPERTRANIILVATHEFSEHGLSGARIDEIAARTHTSKRMIYYYFGSKEGLYRTVLEECYRRIRAIEHDVDLDAMPPLEALAALVRFTFDYQTNNEDFIRLVMVENIHRGENMAALPNIAAVNSKAIQRLKTLCARGVKEGVMRKDLEPIDLHMSISALCFFNVSNRHTFSTIFKVDMRSPKALRHRKETVTEMILRYVTP